MKFPHFFIDRPIFATVLSLLIVLVGGITYFSLPVSQYPPVAPPQIVVRASYPGATPEVIADTVSDLAAFVSIRSGRLLAYLNGLQQRGSSDPSFIVDTTVRAPIAGTIVSLIVPVFSQAVPPQDRPQPQPSLF